MTLEIHKATIRRFPVQSRIVLVAHWVREIAWAVERRALANMLGETRLAVIEATIATKKPPTSEVAR